jgi:hypothetical protein
LQTKKAEDVGSILRTSLSGVSFATAFPLLIQRLKYVQAAIANSTTAVIQSEESLNPVFFAINIESLPMLWQKISQAGG